MKPKITIICPVYNTPVNLLKRTLSSFPKNMDDFQVLIVDDGSDDKQTLEFLQELDSLIYINVIKKQNGGLGSARNYGLKYAIGEYVSFIDSDDYVESNFFQVLYEKAKSSDADIACGLMVATNGKENKLMDIHSDYITNKLLDKVHQITHGSVCNKIFKRCLFNNIKFPEEHLFFEDNIVLIKLYIKSNTVVYTRSTRYFYWFNQFSITRNDEYAAKRINDGLLVLGMIKETTQNLDYSEKIDIINTFQNILVDKKLLKSDVDYRKKVFKIFTRDELKCVANKVVTIFSMDDISLVKIKKIIDFDNDIIKNNKVLWSLQIGARKYYLLKM